jgi:hypothetical protein
VYLIARILQNEISHRLFALRLKNAFVIKIKLILAEKKHETLVFLITKSLVSELRPIRRRLLMVENRGWAKHRPAKSIQRMMGADEPSTNAKKQKLFQ